MHKDNVTIKYREDDKCDEKLWTAKLIWPIVNVNFIYVNWMDLVQNIVIAIAYSIVEWNHILYVVGR